MTFFTSFTDFNVVMVYVGYLADCSVAVQWNVSQFARWQTYETVFAFFSDKLCKVTSGANKLTAFARVEFDVVDNCTYWDVADWQCVTWLDISAFAAHYNVTYAQTVWSEDV